jgi:D-3-phosphoglycerate dehydrogenase
MPKIVVPDDAPPVLGPSRAWKNFDGRDTIPYFDSLPGTEERLLERIAGAEVVINIRSSSKFTARVFERASGLRLVSLWGTGTDNVDLEAAARHGVTITNTPGVSATSIAEHSLALMLAVARRLPQLDAQTRAGGWPRGQMTQLHGKMLGIIGLGAIGRKFARLGEGIGMRVIAWTMHPDPALGFTLVDLDDLLRTSDVVSLHLRLSDQTRGFLGARELGLMKPSAILINTARGLIVEEAAMVDALRSNRLAGAGLDVFAVEPLPAGHELLALPNAVLSPHAAGITVEALEAGLQMALDNVTNFLGGQPTHVVASATR